MDRCSSCTPRKRAEAEHRSDSGSEDLGQSLSSLANLNWQGCLRGTCQGSVPLERLGVTGCYSELSDLLQLIED